MRNSLTIRRWRIDLYESAVYIQKQPDPKCIDCRGEGDITRGADPWGEEPDLQPCDCWNPFHSLRIPLRPRTVINERYPF
ncbi:hypothetical protein [Streptomyces sp. H27-H5]|uniref:hypothetical protein n=1 Tax=Streptomyces sp. H27-H5 TaxID=2996460 RepID=UPI00226E31A0|nr:hypothetical protein [Streptomyces sp. H27-H5]MCY0959928.1 hypothetical protein [Streptomyces sp. H27-H5]